MVNAIVAQIVGDPVIVEIASLDQRKNSRQQRVGLQRITTIVDL